jgi:hypothetical protein
MKSPLRSLLLLALGLVLGASSLAAAAAATAPVHELRIYTTNPGKFDDLLARFRDHTVRYFERHGMRNLGYFTPAPGAEGAGNTLYYFLEHASRAAAAASWTAFQADPEWRAARTASEAGGAILAKAPESIFLQATDFSPAQTTGYVSFRTPRVFEFRRYTAAPGRLPALHAFFRGHVLGFFAKHGMTGLGYWSPTDAAQGAGTEMHYLLAFPSRTAADQSWRNFRADPAFVAADTEATRPGPLLAENGIKSIFLVPVDFSPVK